MRLLLVDLSGLFWAAWHATADQELGAAFELTYSHVVKHSAGHDRTCICIDRPPYRRKEISPAYKSQRDAPDPGAVDQLRRLIDRMRADGHTVWGVDGYEADDVIASACAGGSCEYDVTILSQDKDLAQLVSDADGVCLLNPRTGTRLGDSEVLEKFGVPPARVGDLLALMGDSSDNIPGVPGVGPKKAAQLIRDHGDLSGVLVAVAEGRVSGKLGEALREHITTVQTAAKLVRLTSDLELDWSKPEPAPEADEPEQTFEPAEQEQEQDRPQRAIVRAAPDEWETALEPANMKQAHWIANQLHAARSLGVPNAETALALILKGRSMGLDAVTSVTAFHMIKGRPVMTAQTLVGLCKRSPLCEYFHLVESSSESCTWETKRRGYPAPTRLTWTIADARRAGLGGDNWQKFPRTMLQWRCAVELARAVYTDVTANVYTEGELE